MAVEFAKRDGGEDALELGEGLREAVVVGHTEFTIKFNL